MAAPRIATPPRDNLGEGIVFDERTDLLHWVDITAGLVRTGRLGTDRMHIEDVAVFDVGQITSSVGTAEDGGLVISLRRALAVISPDGRLSIGPDILPADRDARLNDGVVDPQGRYVVGSMHLGEPDGEEVLLRVDADGSVERLRDGILLSNGIAFSPDGRTVYHVDTLAGTISRHTYGPGAFDHDEPWATLIRTSTPLPDGLAVGADGSLWVAHWGGWAVCRYTPDGGLVSHIRVPASQPTRPAFVGHDLELLAVTSARTGVPDGAEPHPEPDHSGALILLDLGIKGTPSFRWRGSTRHPSWEIDA